MIQVIFWTGLGLLAYTYIGYPLLLLALSVFVRRNTPPSNGALPRVSLVISAYNEQDVIEEKIRNSLALDYPPHLLDILVASDGCTDDTNSRVGAYSDEGIRLLKIARRLGKTNVQNRAVEACTGEVIVFTDANSSLEPDAIRIMARHFADPNVGVVEGRRLDRSTDDSATAKMELTFRDYETQLKILESRVGLCFGATGPIYAIRKDCYVPLSVNLISDLMEPITIYAKYGKRQVFEPYAISREDVLSDITREYQRKIRIITRSLNSLFYDKSTLNPFINPAITFQVFSHRLLRWFAPILNMIVLISNFILLSIPLYQLTAYFAAFFFCLVFLGSRPSTLFNRISVLRAPYYYYKVNLAAFMAIINWIRSVNIQTWTPDR